MLPQHVSLNELTAPSCEMIWLWQASAKCCTRKWEMGNR